MDAGQNLNALMQRISWFSSLTDESRTLVARMMAPVKVDAGELLFSEGERGDCMYIIETGEVSVFKTADNGSAVPIATLGPAEVVGEMSLFDRSPRSASVRAGKPTTGWRLAGDDLQRLLNENPAILSALLSSLSARLRKETAAVANLKSSEMDRRLKVAFFDSKSYTERAFASVNADRYALKFFPLRLTPETAPLAAGFKVVCVFVNDEVNESVVEQLGQLGVGLVALRCAGFNNVDMKACAKHDISVVRVPAYSPYAVAEHAVALMLTLNRKIHRSHTRVRDGNFSLEGLVGFDMRGKTVGVVGAGKIGTCVIDILRGFGCNVLVSRRSADQAGTGAAGVRCVALDELLTQSDIITLHAPLTPDTRYLINAGAIAKMKRGVLLINTSRGGLVETRALVEGLKSGKIGGAGLDVYEEESHYFFEDFSDTIITDDVLTRLLTFNNVVITAHQAFLTHEALANIAATTLGNIAEYEGGRRGSALPNALTA